MPAPSAEASALLGAPATGEGRVEHAENPTAFYVEHVREHFASDLSGLRVVVDCANGAYSGLAPHAFEQCGAEVLAIGDVPVRALRVTFVGELGWELYCPTEYGAGLWRTLWEAGREHGLVACGYITVTTVTSVITAITFQLAHCVGDLEQLLVRG